MIAGRRISRLALRRLRYFLALSVVASCAAHAQESKAQVAAKRAYTAMAARYFAVLLKPSMNPALGDECAREKPELGRPDLTLNMQTRSNEPWNPRICYWKKTPER